jgi:Right handed beta helix region
MRRPPTARAWVRGAALGTVVCTAACAPQRLDAGGDRAAVSPPEPTTSCALGADAYYVDDQLGDDSVDGRSPERAWKSLDRVNATVFEPGAALCFRAGGIWSGQLAPQGSGSSAKPIVIDRFGAGARPRIAAGANDLSALQLMNQSYWEINALELTNHHDSVGDYRGISVVGNEAGTLHHIRVNDCFVHDVTGEVNWITGDVADNVPGITFQTGWDASKRTGGIVFEVQANAAAKVPTNFDDVVVENNSIENCSFAGIVFKQLDGSVHWGIRNTPEDPAFTPHTHVVIRDNYLSQQDASLGCNGIYLTAVRDGSIERNVIAGAGTSAIELYYTDLVTVTHNEVYGTSLKAGGDQFNAINTGRATTRTLVQYNYLHENGDGVLLSLVGFGDSVVRYNMFQNNSRFQIDLVSDPVATAQIYNNTLYVEPDAANLVFGFGAFLAAQYAFTNNIFVGTGLNPVLTSGGGITYTRNAYFGAHVAAPASDASAVRSDPGLLNPGQGANGGPMGPAFASLTGYALTPGSPAIDSGVAIDDNGGQDFAGTPLYVGAPDLGAFEHP